MKRENWQRQLILYGIKTAEEILQMDQFKIPCQQSSTQQYLYLNAIKKQESPFLKELIR